MMNVVSSSSSHLQLRIHHGPRRRRSNSSGSGHLAVADPSSSSSSSFRIPSSSFLRRRAAAVAVRAVADDGDHQSSSSNGGGKDDKDDDEAAAAAARRSSSMRKKQKEELERLVGPPEDSGFSGSDLAALIRSKYGRSYDVTLIRKEFMGRNLLAMNVMWKYREQRSFPLTEEEYLLRLDDVAASLRCWGAVAHVRNSLQKAKDRPRIGKAVSIFIDMDQSGGRSNEWIYK